jgi:hypothetical protein
MYRYVFAEVCTCLCAHLYVIFAEFIYVYVRLSYMFVIPECTEFYLHACMYVCTHSSIHLYIYVRRFLIFYKIFESLIGSSNVIDLH